MHGYTRVHIMSIFINSVINSFRHNTEFEFVLHAHENNQDYIPCINEALIFSMNGFLTSKLKIGIRYHLFVTHYQNPVYVQCFSVGRHRPGATIKYGFLARKEKIVNFF